MTILAGIFSTNGAPIPDSDCQTMTGLLSRRTGDRVATFQDPRCFLATADCGESIDPTIRVTPDGSVVVLAGEPLFEGAAREGTSERDHDVQRLQAAWDRQDWTVLARTRGQFCAIHYAPREPALSLATDRLGIRPLYYWAGNGVVVFAGALRILESLPLVSKRLDLRGLVETLTLGYPLADRTPYAHLHTLRAAEVVRFSGTARTSHVYWQWDDCASRSPATSDPAADVADRFREAVAVRLRRDAATTAFLSGGLDSRAIVAVLRDLGITVYTHNFAPPGTQDQVFAARFAETVGSVHHNHPPEGSLHDPRYSALMADALTRHPPMPVIPERPSLIWSGDGGSVGLGHVYLTPDMVALLRTGRRDEAISAFLSQHGMQVVRPLYRHGSGSVLADIPFAGIREELDAIHCEDPGRAFHLFLLMNDQRRHLSAHFEALDLDRLELQLPFFDGDLLASIVRTPLDWCLGHKFYMRVLACLPPITTSIPWQAYPGHVPCPLPVPAELRYQWQPTQPYIERSASTALLRDSSRVLRARDFPSPFLRRSVLRAAWWALRLGVRDSSHVLKQACDFHHHWTHCTKGPADAAAALAELAVGQHPSP